MNSTSQPESHLSLSAKVTEKSPKNSGQNDAIENPRAVTDGVKSLLDIKSLSKDELHQYLKEAETFIEVSERNIKKVPALRGKTILNVFFEASTRTRVSFELAGKRLSADTINISASGSSLSKGENLLDTARTLQAMRPDVIVVRHSSSGAPHFLASHLLSSSIVNAGDGMNEHPTQCLLDLLSLQQHFKRPIEELTGLKIGIVGDIRHSRVARSNVWAHLLLGNSVRLIGPPGLVPSELASSDCFGPRVEIFHDLEAGLEGLDVVMVLRLQKERQKDAFIGSLDEYSQFYGISSSRIAKCCPGALVLHPGPANRGIEISGELLYAQKSLVEKQVLLGVAVRMAVLFRLATQPSLTGSIAGDSVARDEEGSVKLKGTS